MSQFKGSSYASALATLHTLCFVDPWSEDNFRNILNLPTTFGIGDEKGFILYSDLGDDLEILTIAVHPDYRRKGIATNLIKELQNFAQKNQKGKIFLEVNVKNTPAVQLYLKNGFIQSGIRKNYYHEKGQTFDALCFYWQQKNSA